MPKSHVPDPETKATILIAEYRRDLNNVARRCGQQVRRGQTPAKEDIERAKWLREKIAEVKRGQFATRDDQGS